MLSSSGEPSQSAELTIRGTNSINAGTDPLFVLDGIVISAADFNTINPADIESLSVLKDASSTSIYGPAPPTAWWSSPPSADAWPTIR